MLYSYVFLLSDARSNWFWICFFTREIVVFGYVAYFTNVVQLLCSLSGWLHLNFLQLVQDLMEPKPIVELYKI